MGEVLNNGVYLPDRGERNAYDGLKGNWNTLDSIAGKVPGYDAHISDTDIHVTAADKQTWNGKADASHVHNANDVTTGVFDASRIPNLDASKITTGTIDIDRLPQGALERLVKVADQAARYALTASDVQLGDTVQQLDTGVMYVVTDETKLDSADGYTEFTAGAASSVPWTGVTGKPNDYPPSSHTHTKSQITDFPALATVATSGAYNDLNNIPASFTPASHSHGNITNDGKVGTTANKPLITGTGGVVQAGSFGTAANTFCEGNDSRLSDARTPVAHTHGKADITNLFNSANTWTSWQTFENTNGNALLRLRRTDIKIGDAIPSAQKEIGSIAFAGSDNINIGLIASRDESSGHTRLVFATRQRYDSNGNRANNGTGYEARIDLGIDESRNYYLRPNTDSNISLGTSTNKWKTLNGVNPGALSLPKVDGWNSGTEINAAVGIDTTDWDMSGGTWNEMTNNVQDGWVYFAFQNCSAGDRAIVRYYGTNARYLTMGFNVVGGSGAGYYLYVAFPMAKGSTVNIAFVTSGTVMSKFIYPCYGNV